MTTLHSRFFVPGLIAWLVTGCDVAAPSTGEEPDSGQNEPPAARDWAGSYEASGVWTISGPITAQRSLGDIVAEILVDQIVSLLGVPSVLEDEARQLVHDAVADKISTTVDSSEPAQRLLDSPLMQALTKLTEEIAVATKLELSHGNASGLVVGREEIRSLQLEHEGQIVTVLPTVLLPGDGPELAIDAPWQGTSGSDNMLVISPHTFAVDFSKLAMWAATEILPDAELAALQAQAAMAIECSELVASITGGKASFGITVRDISYTVTAAALETACQDAQSDVSAKLPGLFYAGSSSSVRLGGTVRVIDADDDGLADRLASQPDFGGVVTVGPELLAPRVQVWFEATRTDTAASDAAGLTR